MDYTIYIILGILAAVYFLTKGLNRKSSRNRRSRKFMEGHGKDKNRDSARNGKP